MNRLLKTGLLALAAGIFAAQTVPAGAADTDIAFTVEITGDHNTPTIKVTNNSPVLEITRLVLTIGNTAKHFDGTTNAVVAPPGGSGAVIFPVGVSGPVLRNDFTRVDLSGFGPGESMSFDVDVDDDVGLDTTEDFASVFFNNGDTIANATLTVFSGASSVVFTLPNAPGPNYIFKGPLRVLTVKSIAETNGTDYVRSVLVKSDGTILKSRVGEEVQLAIPIGSQVEISAPRQVYKDINGTDITSSVENQPVLIENDAEERFTALGISVNNVPQTGDPTLYRFELTEDTQVEVKWQHDYALTVRSDFANTQSSEMVGGQPLAGPLVSQAAGNPSPAAQKHWIKRGDPMIAQIDGAVLEQTAQPGLDIRYVPKSFVAYGPANRNTSPVNDSERLSRTDGGELEDIYGEKKAIGSFSNSGGQVKVNVTGHGLTTGMRVRITDSGNTAYNKDHVVTVVDLNSFTIPLIWSNTTGNPGVKGDMLRLVDIRAARAGSIGSYSGVAGVSPTTITSNSHGLKDKATILITNAGVPAYNAAFTITKVDANTFTIPIPFASNPAAKGSWRETTYVQEFAFSQVAQRQQVDSFNMWGPAGITYKWQIQYGVKVNVDDVSRKGLPKITQVLPSGEQPAGSQEGVFWFDPGVHLKVVSDAQAPGAGGAALKGWLNGDGFYFPSTGQISAVSGALLPGTSDPGGGAVWLPLDPSNNTRGVEIFQLNRPARVMWRYGTGAIQVTVKIGEFVFEKDDGLASVFTRQPETIDPQTIQPDASVTQASPNPPGPDDMAQWDPVAGRLYPLLPGRFTVPWKPGTDPGASSVDIIVTVEMPFDQSRNIHGHYPHVAGTPPVAIDPDPADNFTFRQRKFTSAEGVVDGGNLFTATRKGFTVLLFSEIQRDGRGQPREFLRVRVVDTRSLDDFPPTPTAVTVGSRILDPAADKAKLGTGYVHDPKLKARYNPFIYDSNKLSGLAVRDVYNMDLLLANPSVLTVVDRSKLPGPIFPVNDFPNAAADEKIRVVWYDDPALNDTILWPLTAKVYEPSWPSAATVDRIVIASQWGSESKNRLNTEQVVAPASAPDFPNDATTYDPSRLQAVQIYQQPNKNQPGYNPNEEHALVAPSLRFADVSPRPPAIYALRANDLNIRTGPDYTSQPFVLVQFFDVASQDFKMKIYAVEKEDASLNYTFAALGTTALSPTDLNKQGHVNMIAGEPVIPFYPLGVAIGASPSPETFGNNLLVAKPVGDPARQLTYWEDHKGSSWAVSGGANAWFTTSFYYPLAPDFWWPPNVKVPPVKIVVSGALNTPVYNSDGTERAPQTGDSVAFLPKDVKAGSGSASVNDQIPTKILYHSDWPVNPPVLKAGETATFSGGENRADNPTRQIVKPGGVVETVETPGLPQVLAFASAEVVFDSLNSESQSALWSTSWTARAVQALDVRTFNLAITDFSSELQPSGGKTRLQQGKYVFNDLPASLQKRFRYDPIAQRLEIYGFVNDKGIGDNTLTAAPPAVYVLEPNILTADDVVLLKALVTSNLKMQWDAAVEDLYAVSINPSGITGAATDAYLVGLNEDGLPARSFGPGLAIVPNGAFLDPSGKLPDNSSYPAESWITVVENNDPSLGGSPITPHVIKVDRTKRYRGSIKTVLSDNVFDENMILRSTGDFGANTKDLVFEWWYRPDDGSLNVPPPDLIPASTPNPWKLFPDPTGKQGLGRNEIILKGNPNAPETLLADTWWFVRYRHKNDAASGSNWAPNSTQPSGTKKYDWAGAGNSDPFHDFDLDGVKDYRAQLAQGWIKRVLDGVNPYEARIRDFEGENPATISSMIAQFGARFEGPVALNPDKDVIENVGLIELYETILKRGRDLSIDLSRPVSTPAISNALELASTRLADFYTLLGNEAYTDSLDPTIGFGSDSVDYGSLAPATFTFQNQQPDLIGEELALLRGVDDFFARPVYNRLFWNFTKGEGEAAYAMNYNISDVNQDGFIDEDDAMILFPQGHGDAWGHYLTALRHQYNLLRHPFFNWVSRSESYNLQDIVITVDFLDERKFAATAAAKAKAGAEIVNLTYRDKYVEDPEAQWQGYTDTNPDRAWGVDEWSRRAGQGAYFDWVVANALLPSEHPNTTLEGVRKVDRENNADIPVISANLSAIQSTMDRSNRGQNPLGLSRNALVFDIDPTFLEVGSTAQIGTRAVQGLLHFDQIYERALKMMENTKAIWDNANEPRNMLRQVANNELEFRNATFQEDLSYRNQLIQIFGKPYDGVIGPGQLYPAGYEGPDLALFMYVPVRQINKDTVPGPTTSWARFQSNGLLNGGDLFDAFPISGSSEGSGSGGGTGTFENELKDVSSSVRALFTSTFSSTSNFFNSSNTKLGLFAVNYTDLDKPKIEMTNYINQLPVTAAGYTFQAPASWGERKAAGELQSLISQMLVQEAAIAEAVGAWDSLSGEIVRIIRLMNARLTTTGRIQVKEEAFTRIKLAIQNTIKGLKTGYEIFEATQDTVETTLEAGSDMVPLVLPTGGLAVSPGDAMAPLRGGFRVTSVAVSAGINATQVGLRVAELVSEIGLSIVENELTLFQQREERDLQIKEWLKELEDKIGDEPIRRIQIFKEIQALRDLSDQYRSKLDEGIRLIDERAAFNKRVAAQTQRNRYQDMTFRVARNQALQTYRSAFDLSARYAYLAAKAYDYETNYDSSDPGSPMAVFSEIMRARTIGNFDETPRQGAGGLSQALAWMKANYESQRGQLGLNTPQRETGKMSLRTELFRILPKGSLQPSAGVPAGEFPAPGMDSDSVWKAELNNARVPDLWDVPEFRYYCRPFAAPSDAAGKHVPQPGLVFRFGSEITAGKNFFGKPLSGGDHAFDPTNYTTKIVGIGVWFSDYLTDDVISDLSTAPRVYLVPGGADIMRVPHSGTPDKVRIWNVLDQAIPVPLPSLNASIDSSRYIPILDTLNGPMGEVRRFSSFRAYHNGEDEIDFDELITDSRLIGRSVWNTQWVLIIPGQTFNADPEEGLARFIDQISDIKLVFETYGLSGG